MAVDASSPDHRHTGAASGPASRPVPLPSSSTGPSVRAARNRAVASGGDTSAYQSSYTSAKPSP